MDKKDILEILNDPKLHQIRFSVGPIKVNSDEYDTVADLIEAGAIAIVPGSGKVARYVAQKNTLYARAGDPKDLNSRTNALHECTHMITDIQEYNVSRLTDEVAAYLAQFTYLLLLAPNTAKPPLGLPLNNMMRQGMDLVANYKLGDPAGYGAIISQSDIAMMGRLVHEIPEYNYDPNERAVADGVDVDEDQGRILISRVRLENDEKGSTKVQYASHENWVTSDDELGALMETYRRGAESQKKSALQRMLKIFLTISQESAVRLRNRLLGPKKGDLVSNRFNSIFPPAVKTDLLNALQLQR